jgi:protein HOOK3
VNTFELPRKITQWSQLEDGQILWQILADVDPDYFHGVLPETDRKSTENWIQRWQNRMIKRLYNDLRGRGLILAVVKHLDRAVTTYIRDECGKLPVLSKKMTPDLKLVAQHGSPKFTAKVRPIHSL